MIIMPSFTVSSDDDDGLQKSSKLSTHVAGSCENNVTLAAVLCERQPTHHGCGGATAHYAEKVDDNFQLPSESTEHRMHNEQDIGRRMLMMEEDVVGMKKGSWEDIGPNNMQISVNGRQSGTSSIGLAHHQHDSQCADRGDEEEACLTPRTKEHTIPSEILICPPPPRKKRRSTSLSLPDCRIKVPVRKQLFYTMPPTSASSSANSASSGEYVCLQRQQYGECACQVVVNPPDLHTFPGCIRALFFHD